MKEYYYKINFTPKTRKWSKKDHDTYILIKTNIPKSKLTGYSTTAEVIKNTTDWADRYFTESNETNKIYVPISISNIQKYANVIYKKDLFLVLI